MDAIKRRVYPGRFICMGVNESGDESIVVYGITGRSPPSRARELVFDQDIRDNNHDIKVEPVLDDLKLKRMFGISDDALPDLKHKIKSGDPDLIYYPALSLREKGIAVSNGKQTTDLTSWLPDKDPTVSIVHGQKEWKFEPDKPNYTSRISAALSIDGRAAFGFIRRGIDGEAYRSTFEIPMVNGFGSLISTYNGVDQNPLAQFDEKPLVVPLIGRDSVETARLFWEALPFASDGKDYRVAVVAVHAKRKEVKSINGKYSYNGHIIDQVKSFSF